MAETVPRALPFRCVSDPTPHNGPGQVPHRHCGLLSLFCSFLRNRLLGEPCFHQCMLNPIITLGLIHPILLLSNSAHHLT